MIRRGFVYADGKGFVHLTLSGQHLLNALGGLARPNPAK